jgi:hypothetical protein
LLFFGGHPALLVCGESSGLKSVQFTDSDFQLFHSLTSSYIKLSLMPYEGKTIWQNRG